MNDVAILTLQDNTGATFYKNVHIDGSLTVGTTNIVSTITNLQNNYYTKTEIISKHINYIYSSTGFFNHYI